MAVIAVDGGGIVHAGAGAMGVATTGGGAARVGGTGGGATARVPAETTRARSDGVGVAGSREAEGGSGSTSAIGTSPTMPSSCGLDDASEGAAATTDHERTGSGASALASNSDGRVPRSIALVTPTPGSGAWSIWAGSDVVGASGSRSFDGGIADAAAIVAPDGSIS